MKNTDEYTRNKRVEKRQINIKWNSRLFFQLGTVVSLLSVFFIMQMDFEVRSAEITSSISEGVTEPAMIHYVMDIDKPKRTEPKKQVVQKREPIKRVVKSSTFEVKPNTAPDVETSIAAMDEPILEAPSTPVDNSVDLEPKAPRLMATVEYVPVFPGCGNLTTNAEKVECMSANIDTFINKNFRKELLENLNPSQTYRVYVNFKINSNGFVTDVIANSRQQSLTKEAQRVIAKLPMMKPGKQGDKNVDVLYSVPIILKVQ